MNALRKFIHALYLGLNVEGFFRAMALRHGKTFFVQIPGLNKVLFSSDVALINTLFQTDSSILTSSLPSPLEPLLGNGSLILLQGEKHSAERRQLKPLFQGACLHRYNHFIQTAMTDTCQDLDSHVNAQSLMKQVTLDIILRAVFGIETPEQRRQFSGAILRLLNAFNPMLLLVPQSRVSFFGISPWDRFLRARDTLDHLIFTEIARRQQSEPGADILSHLLQQWPQGSALRTADLQHIRDELTTLLLAGHETTANTLAWALYYLATRQDWQLTLRQQFQPILTTPSHLLTEQAMKSDELDAFCKEVLRMHPVVPLVIRSVLQPFSWGGHHLEAGTYVGVSTFNLHNDPELYPDPHAFNPTRFQHRKYRAYEFVPFGGGDKKCLGYGFALHEMKIVLANLLARYALDLQTPVTPKANIQGLAMGPKQKILLSLTRLTNTATFVSTQPKRKTPA